MNRNDRDDAIQGTRVWEGVCVGVQVGVCVGVWEGVDVGVCVWVCVYRSKSVCGWE